jgi:hypothetical protein
MPNSRRRSSTRLGAPTRRKDEILNDKMQRGYRYAPTAPMGRNFDPEFRPELRPRGANGTTEPQEFRRQPRSSKESSSTRSASTSSAIPAMFGCCTTRSPSQSPSCVKAVPRPKRERNHKRRLSRRPFWRFPQGRRVRCLPRLRSRAPADAPARDRSAGRPDRSCPR